MGCLKIMNCYAKRFWNASCLRSNHLFEYHERFRIAFLKISSLFDGTSANSVCAAVSQAPKRLCVGQLVTGWSSHASSDILSVYFKSRLIELAWSTTWPPSTRSFESLGNQLTAIFNELAWQYSSAWESWLCNWTLSLCKKACEWRD